jgi:mono/diheme cytochrome c family protein
MRLRSLSLLLLLLVLPGKSLGDRLETDASELERGEYLVTIMSCGGCHTPGALAGRDLGAPLAGSLVGLGVPGGDGRSPAVVYPSNLTSDSATGLGDWSSEQIVRAIRSGQRPDGRTLSPIMPWPEYAHLTDPDARAIAAYLRTLAPVKRSTPRPVSAGAPILSPYILMAPVEPK